MTSKERRHRPPGHHRSWPLVLAAAAVICCLGSTPLILRALNVHLEPVAATSSNGISLVGPAKAASVPLPKVAQPTGTGQPAAAPPAADATQEAKVVDNEDTRIRGLLHSAVHVKKVQKISVGESSLPTLVLIARARPYTAADLVHYGALVMGLNQGGLLRYNVFVSRGAQLNLGGTGLRTLFMQSGGGKFAAIVGWQATLSFHGTSTEPLTITGWNLAAKTNATDQGDGRAYIRDIGGSMTLTNTRVSYLGFWSGRTGGVAWTGMSGILSLGGATDSTFTSDTYGAFLSRTSEVTFRDDLFEYSQLDGVRVHRNSIGTRIISSAAANNGGSGFVVSRASTASTLNGDVAEHNAANGFYIDGRPLVTGASASGGSTTPGSGATIENSAALHNGKTGILLEGGTQPVVRADQLCASVTAIAVRDGATNAVVTGNYIGCSPRTGIEVGPSAPGAAIHGNMISGARMGIVVRDSGRVQLDLNHISGAGEFGITVRGADSRVAGVGNVLAGNGFRAVDARAGASQPALSGTDLTGWAHHAKITFFSYLRFHPLAALWLGMAILVIAAALRAHLRKLPAHPYPASAGRRRAPADVAVAGAAAGAARPGRRRLPVLASNTAPLPKLIPFGRGGAPRESGRGAEAREQAGATYAQRTLAMAGAGVPAARAGGSGYPQASGGADAARTNGGAGWGADRTRPSSPQAPMPGWGAAPGRPAGRNGWQPPAPAPGGPAGGNGGRFAPGPNAMAESNGGRFAPGPDGTAGANGWQFAPGPDGTAGANGWQFAPGPNGMTGGQGRPFAAGPDGQGGGNRRASGRGPEVTGRGNGRHIAPTPDRMGGTGQHAIPGFDGATSRNGAQFEPDPEETTGGRGRHVAPGPDGTAGNGQELAARPGRVSGNGRHYGVIPPLPKERTS